MGIFIEILKKIVPVCITGLITFLVTRYTCQKNIPLDKYEVAYNRVYYPIYRLIYNGEEIVEVIKRSRYYLKKYNKYVDKSTLVAFKFLQDNPHMKRAYNNYSDNIFNMNGKLRSRLGYLEPNILSMYTYSSPKEKRTFRMIFELLGSYLPLLVFATVELEIVRKIMLVIWGVSIATFVIECIVVISLSVKKQVVKAYINIRNKRGECKEKE